MPAAGRLGDRSLAPVDAHGCPACPHPAVSGPAIAGSPTVRINGKPALRAGDQGVHTACCGPNAWQALGGSPTVRINGKPAHRQGDVDLHCGGPGTMLEGSPDVSIGGGSGQGTKVPGISFAEVALVDEQSGAPIAGVLLSFALPGGRRARVATGPDGVAHVASVKEGSYAVSCDLEGARLESTVAVADAAALPALRAHGPPPAVIEARWIAHVDAREVAETEPLDPALARFNEAFTPARPPPRAVGEEPAQPAPSMRTIHVPKPFRRADLATGARHEIRCRVVPDRDALVVRLVDTAGRPVADVGYRLDWAGRHRVGRTDADGTLTEPGLGGLHVHIALENGLSVYFGDDYAPYAHDEVYGRPPSEPPPRRYKGRADERWPDEPGERDDEE
jgi:uncharacterized Zn-binding protein involved in type VI secretion